MAGVAHPELTPVPGEARRSRVPLSPRLRALLIFVCLLVLVDTVFFTALTPLLPYYVRTAGLTKAGAGLLVAFPAAYGIIMPALYLPLITMLLALVFRGAFDRKVLLFGQSHMGLGGHTFMLSR